MEAVRRPWLRIVTVVVLTVLVALSVGERDGWFWLGAALLAVNVVGLLVSLRGGARPVGGAGSGGGDVTLAELRGVPGLAAALASGPDLWQQVSRFDDQVRAPAPLEELVTAVWITRDDGWTFRVGDEVEPYVDLDVPEEDDPALHVLAAHGSVAGAWREDRTVYRVVERRPISVEEFAVLAAQALVAHHRNAVARLPTPEG